MNRFLKVLIIFCGCCLLACCTPESMSVTRIATNPATAVVPVFVTGTTPPPTSEALAAEPTVITTPMPTILPTTAATETPIPPLPPTAVPTAVPTLLTPIQPLATGQSLPVNSDLLFIADGKLQLWQPQTGQVSTLLANSNMTQVVTGWQATPDKQTVLIVQQSTHDAPGFSLLLFDTNSRQLSELWSESDHYLAGYAISGDGQTVAFINSIPTLEDASIQEIKVINIAWEQPVKLADCPNRRQNNTGQREVDYVVSCTEVVAVPDSETWLWRDIVGLWQGGLNTQPRLLVENNFFNDNDPPLFYEPTNDWSSDGRFQMIIGRRGEGFYLHVLDIANNQLIEVPNSASGIERVVRWQWAPNNQLVTLQSPDENGKGAYTAELWHIEAGQFVQDASLIIPAPTHAIPVALTSLADGRFAFIINHADASDAANRNIYQISSFDQPPQAIVSLPPIYTGENGQSLAWAPNNNGILYVQFISWDPESSQNIFRPFYIPADGSMLYDLSEILGNHVANFIWLP